MLAAKRPRAHTDHRPGPARITHQLARLPEPTRTPRPRDALRDPITVNNPAIINDPALGLDAFRDPWGINDPALEVPAAGLGCALNSVRPVNDPALGVPAAGLGCALNSVPLIRDRTAAGDSGSFRGPDRGPRRRTPVDRLGLRAGRSPNTHRRHSHDATPRRAPLRHHSSPQTPHHIRVHPQTGGVAASEAPHCSLVPSLTYRALPSTSPTYQPLPSGPSLDARASVACATALISVWA